MEIMELIEQLVLLAFIASASSGVVHLVDKWRKEIRRHKAHAEYVSYRARLLRNPHQEEKNRES